MIERLRLRVAWMTLLAGGLLSFDSFGQAQEAQPEYKFKAAYLFHFAQFVDWPSTAFSGPTSPFFITVLGDNPFGDELTQALRAKAISGHPVVVRAVSAAAEAATNCHLLFISSSEKKRLPEIFSALRGANVLTVGESEGFLESGGMIKFVWVEKRLQFQINAEAAKRAGLVIRAKLLSLALPP